MKNTMKRNVVLASVLFFLSPLVSAKDHHGHEHEYKRGHEEKSQHDHDHDDHGSSTLGAHEHGVASLSVFSDGKELTMALSGPSVNFFGFEHQVRTEAEKKIYQSVRSQLENPDALFVFPASAQCVLSQFKWVESLESSNSTQGKAKQDQHSDTGIDYYYQCADALVIEFIDAERLFQSFSALERLSVEWLSGQKAMTADLTAENSRLQSTN